MANKKILIIGGSGFIGKKLVDRLENKYDITVMSRNPKHKTSIKGSVLNKKLLTKIIPAFDIIIYLAAIVRLTNKKKYIENVYGLKNTLSAMTNKNKIIYFSTQNILQKKMGHYGKSKLKAEKILVKSKLDFIIIRPSYVYDTNKDNDFYRLNAIIKTLKVAPLIGNGKNKIQPIHVDDVIEATIKYLKEGKYGIIRNVSGEIITLSKIRNILINSTNPAIKINIPIFLLKIIKNFVPFDVEGYNEDKIFKNHYVGSHKISLDLKAIQKL